MLIQIKTVSLPAPPASKLVCIMRMDKEKSYGERGAAYSFGPLTSGWHLEAMISKVTTHFFPFKSETNVIAESKITFCGTAAPH